MEAGKVDKSWIKDNWLQVVTIVFVVLGVWYNSTKDLSEKIDNVEENLTTKIHAVDKNLIKAIHAVDKNLTKAIHAIDKNLGERIARMEGNKGNNPPLASRAIR